MSGDLEEAVRRKGSFWHSLRAVAWSFFGIRKGSAHEHDIARLNPLHVVVAGLVAAALFIIVLVVLVRWIVASGVAT